MAIKDIYLFYPLAVSEIAMMSPDQGRRPCFVLKLLVDEGLVCTLLGSHAAAQAIPQDSPISLTPSSTAAATAAQDVRPLPIQRGTTLDGTMRSGSGIAGCGGGE